MGKIILSPSELNRQAGEMESLQNGFDNLFGNMKSTLHSMNGNWSENLARNFEGKITSAQKSFSNVLQMLGFGSDAARKSAHNYESLDQYLGKLVRGEAGKSGSVKSTTTISDGKEWQTMTLSGKPDSDVKKYYQKLFNTSKSTTKVEKTLYQAQGSKSAYGDLIDGGFLKSWHTYADGMQEKGIRFTGLMGKFSPDSRSTMSYNFNTAEAYVKGIFQPERGSAYVKGNVGYNLMSGSLEMRDPVNNMGTVTFSGNIGASASAEAGFKNGVFKIGSSVTAGMGGGISVDLNLKNTWNAFREAFSDVGRELNELDNKLLFIGR